HAAEIGAETDTVLAVAPYSAVTEAPGLIPTQQRRGVSHAGKICQREIRHAPIERVLRNAVDPKRPGNIGETGKGVCRFNAIAVVINANCVVHVAEATAIADWNVDALRRSAAAADRGKRIQQVAV